MTPPGFLMVVGATCGGRLIATNERKTFMLDQEIAVKCEFEIVTENSLKINDGKIFNIKLEYFR